MGRWFLFFALPILSCALIFEALLVPAEDFVVNFFSSGNSYGAPFIVGVRPIPRRETPAVSPATPRPTPLPEATPDSPERFSAPWFALDVLVTAAIALVIAWFLRIRNAWAPSMFATALVVLLLLGSGSSSPIPIRSFGFSFWMYWLVAFALSSAIWTGLELYRARPRQS